MTPVRIAAVVLALTACSQSTPGANTTDPSSTTSAVSPTATAVPESTSTTVDGSVSATDSPETTSAAPTTVTTAAPVLIPPSLPPDGSICDLYDDPVVLSRVADTRLVEISGIAASRTHDGIIWAVNDSGDAPVIYALDDGATVADVALNAVFPIDWEDLDIGPGPDGTDHLYVADVGDNLGFRPWISIFRLPEPNPASGDIAADAEELELVYPDLDSIDAEAFAVDPITGDVLVIPKRRGEVGVYRAAAEVLDDRTTMERIATLDLGAEITAATFSPNGDRLVLRGYRTIWMWPRLTTDLVDVFDEPPCEPPSARERQGEALTVAPDGSLVTISEGGRPDINAVPLG